MASVKQSWIKKYGQEIGTQMWEEQKTKYKTTNEKLIKKYGKDYVNELNKKKSTYSLQYCITKFGEEEGKNKWNERLNKKLNSQKENFKNKKWKNGRTLEEYQKRYGLEEGYNRWEKRNRNQSYKVSLQRYLDDYGEDGKDIIKRIKDNVSISSFIERYGEEKGHIEYKEYCQKIKQNSRRCIEYWVNYHKGNVRLAEVSHKDYQNKTGLQKFIERFGEDVGREKYLIYLESIGKNNSPHSKISQSLFWNLYNKFNLLEIQTKFYELNEEQTLFRFDSIIKVDFKHNNNIIEFFGDYWHANPILYNKEEIIRSIEVNEIWKKDESRIDWLKKSGYNVLIIWEKDWKENPELVLNNCKKFLIYEQA